jgi:hypothetical protein
MQFKEWILQILGYYNKLCTLPHYIYKYRVTDNIFPWSVDMDTGSTTIHYHRPTIYNILHLSSHFQNTFEKPYRQY